MDADFYIGARETSSEGIRRRSSYFDPVSPSRRMQDLRDSG